MLTGLIIMHIGYSLTFSIMAISLNYSRDMFYSFSTFVEGVVG